MGHVITSIFYFLCLICPSWIEHGLLQETSMALLMFNRKKKNHVWFSNFFLKDFSGIGLYVQAF